MIDIIRSFPSATEGIAAEASLLTDGAPQVLLWQAAAHSIVMPWHFQKKTGFDEGAAQARNMGWPVILRPTGGGAVPQGPGVLNLAMIWPANPRMTIDDAYRALCEPMIAACASFGITTAPGATRNSFCDGTYNLSVGGRKIVGTAQRWRNRGGMRYVLAHAMIMLEPPAPSSINAINALHDSMGLDLPIHGDVHAGLNEFVPSMTATAFANALNDAALSTLRELTAPTG